MTSAGAYLSRMRSAVDFDALWTVVEEVLVMEGLDATLGLATAWGASNEPEDRSVALDLLAGAARDDATGAVTLVLEQVVRVASRDHEDLRWSAAHALGQVRYNEHVDDVLRRRVARELGRFADDEDEDVRWQVAVGLPSLMEDDVRADAPAVETMLRLLRDPDPDVRDWAAFGFQLVEVDSPRIRSELLALTDDPVGDTAAEATAALAQRGDTRVVPLIRAELGRDDVGNIWVQAATALPDGSYLPALRRLVENRLDDAPPAPSARELSEAIDAAEAAGRAPRLPGPRASDHDAGR